MTRYAPCRDSLTLLISMLMMVLVMLAPSHGSQYPAQSPFVFVLEHVHAAKGAAGTAHMHRNSSSHDHSHAILDLQVASSALLRPAGTERYDSENLGKPFDLNRAPDQPPRV